MRSKMPNSPITHNDSGSEIPFVKGDWVSATKTRNTHTATLQYTESGNTYHMQLDDHKCNEQFRYWSCCGLYAATVKEFINQLQLYQLTNVQHGLHWIELWILFEMRTKAFTPPTTDQPYGPSHDPRAPPTLQQTLGVFKKVAKAFIKTLPPAHLGRKMMNTQPAPSTRLANLLISNSGATGYMPTTTAEERDEIQKKLLQLRRINHPNVLTAIKNDTYTATRAIIQMKQTIPWKRQPRLDHDDNATQFDNGNELWPHEATIDYGRVDRNERKLTAATEINSLSTSI